MTIEMMKAECSKRGIYFDGKKHWHRYYCRYLYVASINDRAAYFLKLSDMHAFLHRYDFNIV